MYKTSDILLQYGIKLLLSCYYMLDYAKMQYKCRKLLFIQILAYLNKPHYYLIQ